MPYKHASRETVENPLVYHSSKFFSGLRILFPNFRDYKLEKAILNLSMVMEQEFNIMMQTLKILQSEVNSLKSAVLQHRHVLDSLTAQQGGACAIISEECCFYVNQRDK